MAPAHALQCFRKRSDNMHTELPGRTNAQPSSDAQKPSGAAANDQRTRLITDLLMLAGFSAFFFFFGLSRFGLVGADEPRYAQIAREMLARRDWVTPFLYGKPWLEKPVLYYWETMLAYGVFGVSDWAARLPSAASATAMVVGIYFFVRRFRPGAQLDAALIAASSAAIVGFARAASTDMPLAATFALAMLSWLAWWLSGRKLWLAGFYTMMALATLAKGPVAPFLAALIIVAFAALRRNWRMILRTLWVPGVILYLLLALPWYLAVQASTQVFFQVFFLQHNLERFGTNVFHHPAPFWYYVVVVAVSVAPWTVLAILGFIQCARESRSGPDVSNQQADLNLFMVLWSVLPVVFFSLSRSKLPGYILPAIAPFAILVASYLWRKVQTSRSALALVVLHSALAGIILGAALLVQYMILRLWPPRQAWTIAAIAAFVVFAAMVATLYAKGLKTLRFVALVPVILAVAFLLRIGAPALDSSLSARPIATEIDSINPRKGAIAGYAVSREIQYGLGFYSNQPIPIYELGEIPAADHFLVTGHGREGQVAALLPGRRISHIGGFAAQNVDFYWISTPPPMSGMDHESHMQHPKMQHGTMDDMSGMEPR
jgi:4-amino-4-deoxy-L-arabinose transferase-like glycosyltransferase